MIRLFQIWRCGEVHEKIYFLIEFLCEMKEKYYF